MAVFAVLSYMASRVGFHDAKLPNIHYILCHACMSYFIASINGYNNITSNHAIN